MNLKFFTAFMCAVIATAININASTMPQFSNGDTDHWYHIVFSCGDAALHDKGDVIGVTTAIPEGGNHAQQWKLTGNADCFKMQNRLGNHLLFNGRLRTSANEADAMEFRLVPTGNTGYPGDYELEIISKTDKYNHINQSGGTGPGRTLIAWLPDDPNNVFHFLSLDEIPETTPTPPSIKEFSVTPSSTYTPIHRHTLWYTKPVTAENVENPWMEYALPIGNGEFGAMVYGGVHCDQVQFNDKSVWTGSSTVRGSYQSFGDLYIEDISDVFGNTSDKALTDYYRNLDLTQAKASAHYTTPDGSIAYTREYLASYPDKVVAIKLTASQPGAISVRLSLFNGIKKGLITASYADGCGSFEGKLDLIDFKAKIKAIPTGGTMTTGNNGIEIHNADQLIILLAGATNFDQHSHSYITDPAAMRLMVDNRIEAAASKGWESIERDHIADYQTYFNRVDFSINGAENAMTMSKMVTGYNKKSMPKDAPSSLMLEELYFTYGRYLLIASSRGMDSPANLQGIWNNSATPAWQCDIHSNINVQMNYWPAENTNLSEMHMPYLNYIHSMALEHDEWQEYARRSGQTTGWTCFTQNNIFGHSDYAENYVIANAWYTYHLWQHYIYTLDRDFLKSKALPVMLSCSRFWMERLVKDSDGKWVAPQEWSPEHGPAAEDATAHAQQIVEELLSSTLQAIEILGNDANVEPEFIAELTEKHRNLDKGLAIEQYTGAWGETLNNITTGTDILREWKTSPYSAGENGHRHQSHLMALYPFSQITPDSQWFTPAVNSLRLRGDVSTGWSLGWRINLWARALDGEHCQTIIRSALRHASTYGQSSGGGGIYYNLFDSHAPFQIDGNFGYTAGVTEMLLQSHNGVLRLLPALPPHWKSGHINGLKAVGNFEVSQEWDNSRLISADIISNSATECHINYTAISSASITDADNNPVDFTVIDSDNISFPTAAGATYHIIHTENASIPSVAAGKSLTLTVENGIATASDPEALITAYNLSGHMIASSTGTVDLSPFHNTPVVIKVSNSTESTTVKHIID